jgi:hypothetical protein
MTKQEIINDILNVLGQLSSLKIWANNQGVKEFKKRNVRYGVPEQSDITGILPNGRRLDIIVSSRTGHISDEKLSLRSNLTHFKGVCIIAYSVHDVYRELSREGYKPEDLGRCFT